jgi:hypothetical protein
MARETNLDICARIPTAVGIFPGVIKQIIFNSVRGW